MTSYVGPIEYTNVTGVFTRADTVGGAITRVARVGTVTITADVVDSRVMADGDTPVETIAIDPVIIALDDLGSIGTIEVIRPSSVRPDDFTYHVEFQFDDSENPSGFSFIVGSTPVDLTSVTPVRAYPGTPFIVGPAGPAGLNQPPPGTPDGKVATVVGGAWVPEDPPGGGGAVNTVDLWTPDAGNVVLPRFSAHNAGVDQTGASDATTALNALYAAAEQVGGVVDLENGTYTISGPVYTGSTSTIGNGGNQSKACVIKCNSSTAALIVGDSRAATLPVVDHFHPVFLRGFVIDMNGTGDPKGRLQVAAVKTTLDVVHVTDFSVSGTTKAAMTPGVAVWLNGAQNCTFRSVDADAVQGAALQIDNGAGGNSFRRCEISTSGILLQITDTSAGTGNGGGYPFGPAGNYFYDTIFETRLADSDTLVSAECGTENVLTNCQYSVSTSTGVLSVGALVHVTDDIIFSPFATPFPTHIAIDGGTWNGGAAGANAGTNPCKLIQVDGANLVSVEGIHYAQDYAYFLYNNSSASTVRFNPTDIVKGNGTGVFLGTSTNACDEKQSITFGGAGLTAFTLRWGAVNSSSISASDTPATVQSKLQAMSSIGAGNVKVYGPAAGGAPYLVQFTGALAHASQALFTVNSVTGGTGTVIPTRVQAGGTLPNINSWFNQDYIHRAYKLPASMPVGISIWHDDESHARAWFQRSGAYAIGDGTADPAVGLAYDSTSGAMMTSGKFRKGSGISRRYFAAAIAAAGATFSMDCTLYPEFVFTYVNGSCSLGIASIANPYDGAELTITHIQPAGGGATYAWPSNIKWLGAPPTTTANGAVVTVTFRYISSLALWVELERPGDRQPDIPNYMFGLSHRYEPGPGTYNRTPTSLHKLRGKIGKVLAGVSDCHVVSIGDSSIGGYNGSGAYVYDTNPIRSFARGLATKLGVTWQQGLQWMGAESTAAHVVDNLVLTGTATISGSMLFLNGAGTAQRNPLPGEVGTQVTVVYANNGTNGIAWTIDGAAQTPMATTGTNALVHVTVPGLSSGQHTVKFTTSAGQNLTVTTVMVNDPTKKSVYIHNMSVGGSAVTNNTGTASPNNLNWSSTSNTPLYGLGWLMPNTLAAASITADIVILSLGGNDITLGHDPVLTAQGLATILAYFPVGTPVVLMHAHKVPSVTDAAWNAFTNALISEAETLGVMVFNWDDWEGGLAGATADGLIGTDGTHPLPALQAAAGAQLANAVWP